MFIHHCCSFNIHGGTDHSPINWINVATTGMERHMRSITVISICISCEQWCECLVCWCVLHCCHTLEQFLSFTIVATFMASPFVMFFNALHVLISSSIVFASQSLSWRIFWPPCIKSEWLQMSMNNYEILPVVQHLSRRLPMICEHYEQVAFHDAMIYPGNQMQLCERNSHHAVYCSFVQHSAIFHWV